jgi:streptogramin lyase
MNDFERLIASSLEEIEKEALDDGERLEVRVVERAIRKRRIRTVFAGAAAVAALGVVVTLTVGSVADRMHRSLPVTGERVVVPITRLASDADVTATEGTVWYSDPEGGRIVQLDGTGRELASVEMDGTPGDIEVAFGRMWIADPASARIVQVDLTDGSQTGLPISLGLTPAPIELSADGAALWAVLGRSLLRIDPDTGAVDKISVAENLIDVAGRGDTVWILRGDGTVTDIDRATLQTGIPEIKVPHARRGDITFGAESLWYGNRRSHRILRIDPTDRSITASLHLPGTYRRIAVQPDIAWALSIDGWGKAWATPIEPVSGRKAGRSIRLPFEPKNLAIAAERVWVTSGHGVPFSFGRIPTD